MKRNSAKTIQRLVQPRALKGLFDCSDVTNCFQIHGSLKIIVFCNGRSAKILISRKQARVVTTGEDFEES